MNVRTKMPRTKTNTDEIVKITEIKRPTGIMQCSCGAAWYIYGKSMDGKNIYTTYKCPECGRTENVIEAMKSC